MLGVNDSDSQPVIASATGACSADHASGSSHESLERLAVSGEGWQRVGRVRNGFAATPLGQPMAFSTPSLVLILGWHTGSPSSGLVPSRSRSWLAAAGTPQSVR